jgi:nucleolar protein 14
MAKASQLSQLKSALNSAGLRGQPPQSKKRKRTGRAEDTEREKKAKAARLEDIRRKLNPFDEKATKLKHDVLGRKLKGVVGKPAKSKQTGIEQVHLLISGYEKRLRRNSARKRYSTSMRAGITQAASSIVALEKMTPR